MHLISLGCFNTKKNHFHTMRFIFISEFKKFFWITLYVYVQRVCVRSADNFGK